MKRSLLYQLDELVDLIVKPKDNRWILADRALAKQCGEEDRFLLMLQDSDCFVVFLAGSLVSFLNLGEGFRHFNTEFYTKYILFDGNSISDLHLYDASAAIDSALDSLPSAYLLACRDCEKHQCALPSFRDWESNSTAHVS